MTSSVDKELVKTNLDKVLRSETFRRSAISCQLLNYLVEATLSGENVKEYTIGVELFGEDFNQDESGSKVRVKVYQLRKYLSKYYQKEGKNDPVKFQIDKGQYLVSFRNRSNGNAYRTNIKYVSREAIIAIGCIIIAGFIWTIWANKNQAPVPFWNTFFDSEHRTALVIGDVFFFTGPGIDGSSNQAIRDFKINNKREMYQFFRQNKQLRVRKYKMQDYSYITELGAVSTNQLSAFFARNKHDFDIFMASRTRIETLKTTNNIFIGLVKTAGDFITIFSGLDTNISIAENNITYIPKNKAKSKVLKPFKDEDGFETDFVLVSHFKKSDGKDAFIFIGHNDMGTIAAVNYFTQLNSLESFRDQLPKDNTYFAAVLQAKGVKRRELDIEIVHLEPLDID